MADTAGAQLNDIGESLFPEVDTKLPSTSLPDGQSLIRKYLVYSAVNFINNPRIKVASNLKKKSFLLTKGLTEDEIDLAFELCVSRPSTETALKNELDFLSSFGPNIPLTSTSGFFARLFRLIYVLTIWGGFAYGAYTFYQNTLRPYFDKSCKKKTGEEEICDQIQMLNEQIIELSKNIIIVHEFVRTYCNSRDDGVMQLKNELNSIKSLLVSKNQFPLAPTIPKWQLSSSTGLETSD